jgi:hypothetical protein
MKILNEQFIRMQRLAGLITESEASDFDKVEANADLFINNPALKPYITDKDQYGFSIMEVPVAKLEATMKMSIKDILAKYDFDALSISMDPTTKTVDIILDRT